MPMLSPTDVHWPQAWPTQVPTLAQYVDRHVQDTARRNGLSMREVAEALTADVLAQDWRELVVVAFDSGRHIPTRFLRTLDDGLLYRLARTPRALGSDEVTRDLCQRAGREFLTAA